MQSYVFDFSHLRQHMVMLIKPVIDKCKYSGRLTKVPISISVQNYRDRKILKKSSNLKNQNFDKM